MGGSQGCRQIPYEARSSLSPSSHSTKNGRFQMSVVRRLGVTSRETNQALPAPGVEYLVGSHLQCPLQTFFPKFFVAPFEIKISERAFLAFCLFVLVAQVTYPFIG